MTKEPTGRAPGFGAGSGTDDDSTRRAADRARIDEVFGETMPDTTADEARGPGGRIDDDWWRDQRPPHHG